MDDEEIFQAPEETPEPVTVIQRPAHLKVRKSSKKPSPSPTRRSSQPPTSAPNQSSPVRMRKGSNPPTPTTAGGARPPQFDGPPSPTRYINYRLVNKLSLFCKQCHIGPENLKKIQAKRNS